MRARAARATFRAMSTDPHNRRAPRVDHEVMVAVRSDHGSFTGWGTNLSASGVFVNTQTTHPAGDEVALLLQLPGIPECKLRGRVAWSKPPGPDVAQPGIGIEFLEIDPAMRDVLAQMVQRLTADLAPAPQG